MIKLLIFIIFAACQSVSFSADFSRENLKNHVSKSEKENNIPTGVLDSIITIESNYKIKAINPKDFKRKVFVSSFGLGQLTYATARAHCSLNPEDIYNPIKNINCSAKVLKYQIIRYKDNISMAVAAYNLGTPCVCNGSKYLRNINGKIKVCQKYLKNSKTNTYEDYLCSKKDLNKHLNQQYVNDFMAAYKKITSNSNTSESPELTLAQEAEELRSRLADLAVSYFQ